MQDLDKALLNEFRDQVRDTGSGRFYDPAFPYAVTVAPSKHGHWITVEDTRKRWFGREVLKREHLLADHSPIVDNGPATIAIQTLEMVIAGGLPL